MTGRLQLEVLRHPPGICECRICNRAKRYGIGPGPLRCPFVVFQIRFSNSFAVYTLPDYWTVIGSLCPSKSGELRRSHT